MESAHIFLEKPNQLGDCGQSEPTHLWQVYVRPKPLSFPNYDVNFLSLKRPLWKGSAGTASPSVVDNCKSCILHQIQNSCYARVPNSCWKDAFQHKSILKTYRSAVRLPPLDRFLLYTRLAQNFNAKSSYCRDVQSLSTGTCYCVEDIHNFFPDSL